MEKQTHPEGNEREPRTGGVNEQTPVSLGEACRK